MPITEYHQAQPALIVENSRFRASITNVVQRKLSLFSSNEWLFATRSRYSPAVALGSSEFGPALFGGLLN